MINKEQCQALSKLLDIEFVFPKLRLTKTSGIFCTGNTSYVYYDEDSKSYDFLLRYNTASFVFRTKSLDPIEIHQEMKKTSESIFQEEVKLKEERDLICDKLREII